MYSITTDVAGPASNPKRLVFCETFDVDYLIDTDLIIMWFKQL